MQALPELAELRVGLLHVHILHTSASLTLNENASPDVRRDFATWFDQAVPERFDWEHSLEGPDDMPAHIKASLLGPSLTLPIARGRLALGTWQGIYLVEHRSAPNTRASRAADSRVRYIGWYSASPAPTCGPNGTKPRCA